jgi:hypothetical protein
VSTSKTAPKHLTGLTEMTVIGTAQHQLHHLRSGRRECGHEDDGMGAKRATGDVVIVVLPLGRDPRAASFPR